MKKYEWLEIHSVCFLHETESWNLNKSRRDLLAFVLEFLKVQCECTPRPNGSQFYLAILGRYKRQDDRVRPWVAQQEKNIQVQQRWFQQQLLCSPVPTRKKFTRVYWYILKVFPRGTISIFIVLFEFYASDAAPCLFNPKCHVEMLYCTSVSSVVFSSFSLWCFSTQLKDSRLNECKKSLLLFCLQSQLV